MSLKYFSPIRIVIVSIFLLLNNSAFAADNKITLVGVLDTATGLYISGDNKFRVTLPVKGTPDEVRTMVSDVFTNRSTLVSIKPEKNGGSYRLEITRTLDTNQRKASFLQASSRTFEWYRRLAIRSYQSPLVELNTYTFTLNGRQSIAVIYKQLSSATQGPRFHLFYLTDFGQQLAFLWTDIPLAVDNIEIEEQIIDGSAEQVTNSIAMLRSLTFN